MRNSSWRALIPCAIVLTFTLLPLWLYWNQPTEDLFDAALRRIATEPDIQAPLEKAESFIKFFLKGGGASAQRYAADFHFRIGEAIHTRPDTRYLETALTHYETAVKLYPSLRHGWPFYQMGVIQEKMNRLGASIHSYQQVALYDDGQLAIEAGFRIATLYVKTEKSPLPAFDLYNYFRFAADDVLSSALLFAEAELDQEDYGYYIKSLIARARNQTEEEKRLLSKFREQFPSDPSAAFRLDELMERPLHPAYPLDGDLIRSCYAPLAYRNGGLYFQEGGRMIADFYYPENVNGPVTIRGVLAEPYPESVFIDLNLNGEAKSVKLTGGTQQVFSVTFDSTKKRNLLQISLIRLATPAQSEGKPSFLILRELKALRTHEEMRS